MKIKRMIENNRAWASEKLSLDADYFTKLSMGQDPDILYIGCSDSRVTAEQMLGAEPGDIFVHRNIANLVPSSDESSKAVVQYAVEALKVKNIIVCGHQQCGGVKAAMSDDDLGALNNWVNHIRSVKNSAKEELSKLDSEQEQYERLIELNALAQLDSLMEIPVVKEYVDRGELRLHAWVFDMHTGLIRQLN